MFLEEEVQQLYKELCIEVHEVFLSYLFPIVNKNVGGDSFLALHAIASSAANLIMEIETRTAETKQPIRMDEVITGVVKAKAKRGKAVNLNKCLGGSASSLS